MPVSLKEVNFKLPVTAQPIRAVMGSEWFGKLVSPLHAPALSKEGMGEIADRVKYIGLVAIVAVIAIAIRFIYSRGFASSSAENASDAATLTLTPPGGTSPHTETRVLQELISKAAGEINTKYDALFSDLKKLRESSRPIELELQAFHEKFDKVKNQSVFNTYFKAIEHIENSLRQLLSIRNNLFLAPVYLNDKGIIRQPSDGNCLFHALGQGLKLLQAELTPSRGPINEELFYHGSLRDTVVTWMRENISKDVTLQNYIEQAIGDYFEVRKGQYSQERASLELLKGEEGTKEALYSLVAAETELKQIEAKDKIAQRKWYLERVGQPAFFGSVAEIYAFSRLFPEVKLKVWRELPNGNYSDCFDAPVNIHGKLEINLAYNKNGDHFDLRVPPAS